MKRKLHVNPDSSMKKKRFSKGLPVFNPHAAGIDIGDTFHAVAINDESGGFEVREYPAYTRDLKELVSWLKNEGVTTVSIESTGIYWLNVYLLLRNPVLNLTW